MGRNSLDNAGMQMISSAHFARNYNNAFWDGSQVTYGDGDRRDFRGFSGGPDPAGTPDWLIAEDISLVADAQPGFRNMGDPREDDDPDHYSEFVVTVDNGGVHTNSAIPNHAYFLAANGGRNAGCDAVGSNGHTHTVDCDVNVQGVGLAVAQQTFYLGFTSLQETANMCDARNATVAASPGANRRSISDAWAAVGVKAGYTPAPPPPPCGDATATIPFESEHPYRNSMDCTWTYDHGSASYALHFSLVDVDVTTPCINTNVSNVRLRTDGSVVAQGFVVDVAVGCG